MPSPDAKPITSRFAPTTSGRAHPGTLLAGLLAWLDARYQRGRIFLRLENLDPVAASPVKVANLMADLDWFGLDWDGVQTQSELADNHAAALDCLATQGRLYACSCTRGTIRTKGWVSASGGWVYPGTCRAHRVTDWRSCPENLRCDLGDTKVEVNDESGLELSQNIAQAMGDPIVRRGDGTVTYQLAVVADDAQTGVNRVVRGRDLATSTATQAALWDLLETPRPIWRHHLLLLEPHGEKLAKFHQSVGADALRLVYTPRQMITILALVAGILPLDGSRLPYQFNPQQIPETRAQDLLKTFSWDRVQKIDQVLAWDGKTLVWQPT